MVVFFKVQIDRPEDIGIRQFRQITKAAHEVQGNEWAERYLPLHFKETARRRYKYRPRAKKTRERKRKAAARGKAIEGGTVDLVWTGRLRQLMTEFQVVRAFPTRVTINMIGPRYVRFRVYKANQPDKVDEITRTVPSEKRILSRTLHDEVIKRMEHFRRTRRKRKKV